MQTESGMTDAYLLIRSRVIFTSGAVFLLHIMCISLQKRDFSLAIMLELGGKAAGRTWIWNPDTNSSGITLSLAKLGHQAHSHCSDHLTFSSYPTDSVCVCLCEYTQACLHVCACIYIHVYAHKLVSTMKLTLCVLLCNGLCALNRRNIIIKEYMIIIIITGMQGYI